MTMKSDTNGRRRIALITNHGYAGVEIPVGGAPDTGGQNFYVNSLARTLDEVGFDVTIFARGGFPFFGTEKIRQGIEQMTDNIRYVYVPGGPAKFLPKEDIAIALDEETRWIHQYVLRCAAEHDCPPWAYYEIVNSHYWDAAIIGVKLIERLRDDLTRAFMFHAAGGMMAESARKYEGQEAHRRSLSREVDLHLGRVARQSTGMTHMVEIAATLVGHRVTVQPPTEVQTNKQDLAEAIALGRTLRRTLEWNDLTLDTLLRRADNHVWTPHSVGAIKERNFWDKDEGTIRALKFRERNAHEEVVCRRTPMFCSTSAEIWRALVSYHGVSPKRVFDFPPCIDVRSFRPREQDEMAMEYEYLAGASGVPVETLKQSKIIFETSRMDHTKRKDILLRAFAKIVRQHDDAYLFIGGGPETSPVFQEIKELHQSLPELHGKAFLLGFIPDEPLDALFALASIFVSASEMEGYGMSVSQAAASGTAVIASDLIPFATQWASEASIIVPAGDVEGFAAAMDRLLNDSQERDRRGIELLEVARKLDWPATTGRFIQWCRQRHTGLSF